MSYGLGVKIHRYRITKFNSASCSCRIYPLCQSVQWGMQEGYVYLPISATVLIAVVCNRQDSGEYADADNYSQTGVGQYANAISTWSWYQPVDGSPHSINWIAICR